MADALPEAMLGQAAEGGEPPRCVGASWREDAAASGAGRQSSVRRGRTRSGRWGAGAATRGQAVAPCGRAEEADAPSMGDAAAAPRQGRGGRGGSVCEQFRPSCAVEALRTGGAVPRPAAVRRGVVRRH